ncbi:MAG: hypothetical protein E7638_07245 [Ruminococcaceae bacterium]|nr:hypothetical protein [Oscillospiraceae bacterium]
MLSTLLIFTACTEPAVYNLSDFIPPLMNIETQYPYVESIAVCELSTGETVTLTDAAEHNRLRMHFEELQCLRAKGETDAEHGYSVTFFTVDGEVEFVIPTVEGSFFARFLYTDGYCYEILTKGVDTAYFASLFDE